MELPVLSPTSPKQLVTLLCPTLYNAMYCSPPGSSVHDFSRKEYWSEEPLLSPGDLPDPGIETRSPALQADSLPVEPPGKAIGVISITKCYHGS